MHKDHNLSLNISFEDISVDRYTISNKLLSKEIVYVHLEWYKNKQLRKVSLFIRKLPVNVKKGQRFSKRCEYKFTPFGLSGIFVH